MKNIRLNKTVFSLAIMAAAFILGILIIANKPVKAGNLVSLNGVYFIKNGDNKYLTMSSDKIGATLSFENYNSSAPEKQKFSIIPTKGGYKITTENGYALTASNNNTSEGTWSLTLEKANGNTTQLFNIVYPISSNKKQNITLLNAPEYTLTGTNAYWTKKVNAFMSKTQLIGYFNGFTFEKTQFYKRSKVVDFILRAYNTTYQECVSLGSSALYAAGVKYKELFAKPTSAKGAFGYHALITTVGKFYNTVINKKLGVAEKAVFISENKISNKNVQAGDFLIVKKGKNSSYMHLAVISSVSYDSSGRAEVKLCQRNPSRLNSTLTKSWGNFWGKDAEVYILKITY